MIKLKSLLAEGNIIYARGFPYGAPLVMLRGGGTRDSKVKAFLKQNKFRWDGEKHAWTHYLHGPEFKKILLQLKKMGHDVRPKQGMDSNYVIRLEGVLSEISVGDKIVVPDRQGYTLTDPISFRRSDGNVKGIVTAIQGGKVYFKVDGRQAYTNLDTVKLDEYDRDYKDEYKKFQSSPKMRKYRSQLNKYNRKKGTYGNKDGKDASHKGGKISGFESQSKNRGRREKSRRPWKKGKSND